MTAPHADPSKWTDFVSHQPGHRITAAEPFEHTLAVHEWVKAQPRIRLVNTDGESRLIELTQSPHDIEFGPNENFSTDQLRVRVQSLTQPSTIIDINIHDLSHHVIRQTPTPGVDLNNYVSERHWATADDGTNVPYDIVRHKDHRGALPQSSTPMAHTKFPFRRGFRYLGSHSLTVDSPGCLYTPRRR